MAYTRRPIANFLQPLDPLQGGKAGSKDPRKFASGNIPGQQWDIQQFAADRAELDRAQPPQYAAAHAARLTPEYIVRTIPTRMNMTVWTVTPVAAEFPTLLVPRNPNRLALVFSAVQAEGIGYSFGYPIKNSAGVPEGFFLAHGDQLILPGGVCPIDDLWVWSQTAGLYQFAYEGMDALEANP